MGDIDANAIVAVLRPISAKTPETASLLRTRIETILDAAKAKGLRTGDNPAAWAVACRRASRAMVGSSGSGTTATIRDRAGEQARHARELIEHARAHQLADESEAACQRGDLLQKRRALMEDWIGYCTSERLDVCQNCELPLASAERSPRCQHLSSSASDRCRSSSTIRSGYLRNR